MGENDGAGAGIMMFGCITTFFGKMATLISGTIIFSLLLSLFWFMPLLCHFGPEDDFGTVDALMSKLTLKTEMVGYILLVYWKKKSICTHLVVDPIHLDCLNFVDYFARDVLTPR